MLFSDFYIWPAAGVGFAYWTYKGGVLLLLIRTMDNAFWPVVRIIRPFYGIFRANKSSNSRDIPTTFTRLLFHRMDNPLWPPVRMGLLSYGTFRDNRSSNSRDIAPLLPRLPFRPMDNPLWPAVKMKRPFYGMHLSSILPLQTTIWTPEPDCLPGLGGAK